MVEHRDAIHARFLALRQARDCGQLPWFWSNRRLRKMARDGAEPPANDDAISTAS